MPATIHHDPTCPTLNAHRVTDGLGRELWAVCCASSASMKASTSGNRRHGESMPEFLTQELFSSILEILA